MTQFTGYIVNRLFSIGLSLDSAHSIVGEGPAGDRIAAATDEVDRLIRAIRDHAFAELAQGTQAGLPLTQRADQERSPQPADRAALLQERMVRTARALHAGAADYVALLEQRAELTRQPERMDYPAEIKRWRAFADQAKQMAERWEQSPLPDPKQPAKSSWRSGRLRIHTGFTRHPCCRLRSGGHSLHACLP